MKNRFDRIRNTAVATLLVVAVGGCKGDAGPVGPKGDPGQTGQTGPTGVIATTVVVYSTTTTDATPGTAKEVRTFPSFTKANAGTKIQVVWNSHVSANGGFCNFQVRVDGVQPSTNDFGAVVSGATPTNFYPVSTTNVTSGLAAGTHTLSLWIRGVGATSCTENPGNYERTITVTEY